MQFTSIFAVENYFDSSNTDDIHGTLISMYVNLYYPSPIFVSGTCQNN